jgi:sulfite reductase (NADPH) hemoprotein beta-component
MADETGIYRVVTANRLRDGVIVYYNKDSGWTADIREATVASGEDVDALAAVAEKDAKANVVVGVYAIEITGDHQPLSARERIRSAGPSVRYGDDALPRNNSDFEI